VGHAPREQPSSDTIEHVASNPERIDVSTALETLAGSFLSVGASMALVRTELLSYFQSTSPLTFPSLEVSGHTPPPPSSHIDAPVSMPQAPTVSSVILPTTADMHAWRLQLTPDIAHALIDAHVRANQPAAAWDVVQQMFLPAADGQTAARLKANGITLHWMSVISAQLGQVRDLVSIVLCHFSWSLVTCDVHPLGRLWNP
jgi:hypothetical protein